MKTYFIQYIKKYCGSPTDNSCVPHTIIINTDIRIFSMKDAEQLVIDKVGREYTVEILNISLL